jgi:hypothetical protein
MKNDVMREKSFGRISDSEDDNEISTKKTNKKVCEYGHNCYRKNPEHWKTCSHSPPPSQGSSKGNHSYLLVHSC